MVFPADLNCLETSETQMRAKGGVVCRHCHFSVYLCVCEIIVTVLISWSNIAQREVDMLASSMFSAFRSSNRIRRLSKFAWIYLVSVSRRDQQ